MENISSDEEDYWIAEHTIEDEPHYFKPTNFFVVCSLARQKVRFIYLNDNLVYRAGCKVTRVDIELPFNYMSTYRSLAC